MRNVVLPAVLLACAFSAPAQLTAVLNRPRNRSPEVEIRNLSSLSLSALAVTMSPAAGETGRAPFVFFIDTAVDTGRASFPEPNQPYAVPIPDRLRPGQRPAAVFEPPIVTAGIYSDGTTTGDPTLVARLLARRAAMFQAVELATTILSDAGRHNPSRDHVIAQFQQLAESLDHWYLPPEQQAGRVLYQSLVDRLKSLPDSPMGAAFPPTAFVAAELTVLHGRRVALLESQPSLAAASIPRQ